MDDDETTRDVGWSFWAIGVVALIWNSMTLINFFVQMNPGMVAAYRESERAIIEGRPLWASGAFAIAAFGGALGSVFLLLRKSAANHLFAASLLGVIVTMAHTLGSGINFGIGEIIGIILLPVVVAGFLLWYSRLARSKAWLR